ncbi:hypothetical protein J4050_08990 [Winogradskyella sp. DF17]|uniref:PH domain-containing protein n=1 Tax=Winogradskyella pelagia TaxID=2819984 RepID=A0ABS3T2B0_9FLAO|nr:hypothetical protein [Winogradskyella sp. DF17]MBO3116881.1 hypothetical protein [Winogradskyella sp. DF17]
MRTDNRNVKNTVISIYFILIVLAILLFTVFRSLNVFTENTFYVFLGAFLMMVLFHAVASYFEYDSDGDKISVINKGLILTEYINYREKHVEFIRNELVGFKFRSFIIYKSLTLILKSKDGTTRNERFNVTLVKRRKRRYVRQSLGKTIKLNKKKNQDN